MNLHLESIGAARWIGRVTRAFLTIRFWTTLALIISSTGEQITRMLAFLLPLKVVLLAGSDGVPRYFQFFVAPDQKMPWIIGLSIGAVLFYITSLLLESVGRGLAEAGSNEVLQGANEVAVTSDQRKEARSYFAKFSSISSNLLLALITGLLLLWANPLLFFVLAGLILLEYLVSASFLYFGDPLNPNAVLRMMAKNLSGYLTIFKSINFLSGFFVILVPYVVGSGPNIILAIISILLLRMGLGALSSAISTAIELWRTRALIDPMVFRDARNENRERSVIRELRKLFGKGDRERVAAEKLDAAGYDTGNIDVLYRDFKVKNVYTFEIFLPREGEQGARFRQQVFPHRQLHLLENEEFLFQHIGREQVKAPLVRARFSEGPFECQILDYGRAKSVDAKTWPTVHSELMSHLWSFAPPQSLIGAYGTSRATLEGRLTEAFFERVTVALDNAEEQKVFGQILDKLPAIASLLRKVPVCILNPDIARPQVIVFGEGDYRIMLWQRWEIDHIGVGPATFKPERLNEMLAEVRDRRGIPSDALTVNHVQLAGHCRVLEEAITADNFNSAIRLMRKLLSNPLLAAQ